MTDTKYYAALEVTPDADGERIAAAYRRLALQYHPLRNAPNARAYFNAKFAAVSEAYEVLSDPVQKRAYDCYGLASLKAGVETAEVSRPSHIFMGNPYKVFVQFFGSENPWFNQLVQTNPMDAEIQEIQNKARAEDVEVTVFCSLFELYNGALKDVEYEIREVQAETGETYQVAKMLTVTVKPGYGEHTTLRFERFGNHSNGAHPSDLVIRFKQAQPDGGFTRDHDTLYYSVEVTLQEAFELKPAQIKTLDGRFLLVTPNEIITPQTRVVIANEGMPASHTGNFVQDTAEQLVPLAQRKKGDLIVRYSIVFPAKILSHHKETILAALL